MTTSIFAGAGRLAAVLLLAGGCAGVSYSRLEKPVGASAMGLSFGTPRDSVEGTLRDAEIPFAAAPGDPDAVVASRCPGAPARTPCRLIFGPKGLYAAQIEAPPGDAGRLLGAAEGGLGEPTRRGEPEAKSEGGIPVVLAAWDRDGWTVGVTRQVAPGSGGAVVLRVELDAAAPPVVAGVPLARRRAEVEHVLEQQGAVVVQKDDEATTYLGCPLGDGAAVTCVVTFQEDRAASVTEVHPTPPGDDEALAAWKVFAARFATEIGREPVTSCPPNGPERATSDCTATWASDRLIVVVGAHRNAGGNHRGGISVYTAWSYPSLAPEGGAAPEE
jgi:hypothetical protein